jgi:hypothetical protein
VSGFVAIETSSPDSVFNLGSVLSSPDGVDGLDLFDLVFVDHQDLILFLSFLLILVLGLHGCDDDPFWLALLIINHFLLSGLV